VREVPTFTEVFSSRHGLHLWVQGTLAGAAVGTSFEAYDRGRFIAVTGERYPLHTVDHFFQDAGCAPNTLHGAGSAEGIAEELKENPALHVSPLLSPPLW